MPLNTRSLTIILLQEDFEKNLFYYGKLSFGKINSNDPLENAWYTFINGGICDCIYLDEFKSIGMVIDRYQMKHVTFYYSVNVYNIL